MLLVELLWQDCGALTLQPCVAEQMLMLFAIKTNLANQFNLLDPIAAAILIITGLVATWSTRAMSLLNWIASIANMTIILFVIIVGLVHAEPSNPMLFLSFGVRGIFKAASVLFFVYLGFDAVATMAEETKSWKGHTDWFDGFYDYHYSLVLFEGF